MVAEHVPFQVQLTREQHRRLKRLASARGTSMGSLIRESVADYLSELASADDPALGIIGLIDDRESRPFGSVATEHDAYLADAASAEGLDRPTAAPEGGGGPDSPPP